MTDGREVEATELHGAAVSSDGARLRLRVRDQRGQTVCLSLPVGWMNSILNALPRQPCSADVHRLDSWSIDHTPQGLVLTLRTPEGQATAFAIKSWQVEGMATVATYGNAPGTLQRRLH